MLTSIQTAFSAGEVSPSLFGRVDLAKYKLGASTCRNFFVNYRGGATSRAGLAYVGTCKQPGTGSPPRDIKFQFNINQGYCLEFGDQYMRIKFQGAYVTESTVAVSSVSTAGLFTTGTAHGYTAGDWVFDLGNTGFNGLTWIIASTPASNTFTVTDLFGNPITSAIASTIGTVARIYTVAAPYAAIDLPYLKYTQSADTMSLTCVNQVTLTEYPPYDLKRMGNTNWVFSQLSFASSIIPPTGVTATPHASTTVTTFYSYIVTAVSATTGEESIASLPATCENNDISVFAGTNTIAFNSVTGAGSYNVYKATPSYNVTVPVGSSYGFIGTSFGGAFTDTNIVADFTQVPPVHNDPFARGKISNVVPSAAGTGYTQATVGYSVSGTGTGFVGVPVVSASGTLVAFIIQNSGSGYAAGATITITDSGGGTGATVTVTVGPQTGTYPGAVAYFQQRRVYASTLNNPDTYYMSQPGAYLNFDSSIPVTDSDSITGTPWAQQINGVQALVPMPGGLVIFTGNGAWQLSGGTSAAITPSDETATPQAYNGCSPLIQPIPINYDILFVQAKGSVVRDLQYNFFANIYTGTDQTVLSNHLFDGYTILQWAYAEEPYKVIWAVRNDGILLSFTYLKEQDVYGWARHDTDGLVVSVVNITEPPVDAIYVIVKRYIQGQWVYYSERMDNRIWNTVEQTFCVDAGLRYPMASPNATLTPAAANGTANITTSNLIFGGINYTSPTIRAIDPTGQGSGATFTATIVSGVITAINVITPGANYAFGTTFQISDPTGSGAVVNPVITNLVTFNASASVFSSGNVGNVIRAGGGVATITSFISGTQVVANITIPITQTLTDNPTSQPVPQIAGNWTISVPTTAVSGLNHLNGQTVSILADGSVIPPQVVTNNGVTLPSAASNIVIGLPFICQLQTLYLDAQAETTMQGHRKNIYAVTVRAQSSRGITVGANQPDSSTQPNNANVAWNNMQPIKQRNQLTFPGQAIPLETGDEYVPITSDWNEKGQVAIQVTDPLPANILAVVAWYQLGDTDG